MLLRIIRICSTGPMLNWRLVLQTDMLLGSTNHEIEVHVVQAQILQRSVDRFGNFVHPSVVDLSHVGLIIQYSFINV